MKFKLPFGLCLSRGVQQEGLRTWFSRVVDVGNGALVSQPHTCAPCLGPALGEKLLWDVQAPVLT